MLWIWEHILGYLNIKICGENSEGILNKATANRIVIWNLHYKNGCIFGNISVKDFYRLREIKRGIKCKICIVKRYGINFKFNKYKNRIGLAIGSIIFTLIILFLSNFVWIINVEGNNLISTEEILAVCRQIGIYEGIAKNKINNKYDAQRIQLVQKELAWCGLNVEGCVLTVNVSEVNISNEKNREKPSNLKAKIEGKVKRIDVTSGDVVVKVGDIVSKGDLLVSGVVENLSSTHFVHSEGTITAETKRVFSSEGKYTQTIAKETGKCYTHYNVDFFNIKIPLFLGNMKKEHKYNYTIKNLTLFEKKIPIKILTERYLITKQSVVTYDQTELEKMLYEDIVNQMKKFNFIKAVECEREIIKTEKGILLKITYDCEENIALQEDILLDNEN